MLTRYRMKRNSPFNAPVLEAWRYNGFKKLSFKLYQTDQERPIKFHEDIW